MDQARVLVISLGGTIAMTRSAGEAATPSLDAEDLVETLLPEPAGHASVIAKSFIRVPSAYLRIDDVISLAQMIVEATADGFTGVVITQGTDTLEEVAFALDLLLDTDVPIVVTGAMRNPSQPGADGPANLSDAVAVASSECARGLGTLVVFGGEIHAARFVRKTHSVMQHAFASVTGPFGWVAEGAPQLLARPKGRPHVALATLGETARPVALLRISMGDDGRLISAVENLHYDGLVVEALGVGHVPAGLVAAMERVNTAMPVVLCSRTGCGPVLRHTYGFAGSEQDLLNRGLISGGYLDGLKARIALTLLLRSCANRDAIRALFVTGFGALP